MSRVDSLYARQGRGPRGNTGRRQTTKCCTLVRIGPGAVHIDHVFPSSRRPREISQLRSLGQGEWPRSARWRRRQERSQRRDDCRGLHAFAVSPGHDHHLSPEARHRRASARARTGSPANWNELKPVTTSKDASPNGTSSRSATLKSPAGTRSRAIASRGSAASKPDTFAPREAAI